MNAKLGLLITKFMKTLLLLLLITSEIQCFNVDVVNYIRHELYNNSMFGFSVALHQEQQRSWVIIGAPQADTSNFQSGVRNGGAVYRCDISDDNRCQVIHFDSHGNSVNDRQEQIDTKSNQWFGATVSSAGIDGPLVACAPRYVYHQHHPKKVERIEPVGTCFIAKDNFREFQEFSPCRTMYWGYHRQGSCQAGLSAAVNKAGDRLFIGAPGSWYWQGQVYSINTDAVLPYKPPRYGQFGEGQMYSYSLNNPKDRVYATKESSSKEDDSYLGYSSISGDFEGNGAQGVAVGMPRGAGLLGKVLIFTWNLTNSHNITGEQIGAYFGYSLCSIDVDGDKLDDLIIGAPMYTEPNNEGKYETGRVYIVYQNKANKFKEVETREGVNSRSRFGLALASLGDINLDGYGDFAVGAPYDGPNGKGAVYIYHGSKDGPLKKASQVIFAEDVLGTDYLSTFGFSIAGGIDLDGNQYPDMVVGAYESSRAIVFKSRPVAVVEASTIFDSDNKLISLDNKNCTLAKDGKKVTCTKVTSCLKYNGLNLPASIDIDISWVLDSKKVKNPRMFFHNNEGKNIVNSTMRLYRGKPECRTDKVYIGESIRDKLTPLEVEMKYSIRETTTRFSSSSQSRVRRAVLEPVLDENRGTIQRDSINIMKNCGKDNICIPDLRLDVKTAEKYILGGNESLNVEVLISNYGEDAFEASFYMNVPQGLEFKNTKKIGGESREATYICTAPSSSNNFTLKCDIGNPLQAGKNVNFEVNFSPSRKAGLTPFYDFYMEANSTNEEAEGGHFDNIFKKSVSISIESDLSISGNSMPSDFHYNVSQFLPFKNATNEADIGPQVIHIYDIRNTGTSTIDEIELFINWPASTLDNDPLIYLLSQPETQGNVYCEPTQYANVHELKLDNSLERKSYLDKNRAPIRSGGDSRWSSSSSSSSSGSNRYNTQGGATFDEKQILDREDSQESTGDASFVHKNRGHYHESWRTQGGAQGQGQGSSNTVVRGRGSGSSGVTSQSAQSEAARGSNANFNWESSSNRQKTASSGNQGSSYDGTYDISSGGRQVSRGKAQNEGKTQYESSSRDTNYDSRYEYGSRGEGSAGSGGRQNAREYEYTEQWNSSSVNGKPAVTHYASQNKTFNRNQDGRVLLSETSTETVITGSVGQASWSNRESSSSQIEYERQQREYYEQVRKRQEEEQRRQLEERRRKQEEQRRAEEERIRAEEERYRIEEERRRYEAARTSSTSSSSSSGSGFRLNYEEEQRRIEEEQRRIQEEQRRIELERIRVEEERRRYEEERRLYEASRKASQGSATYESSFSRQSGSRGGSAGGSSGGTEVNYDENVHQDISTLAARTHAEQSSGSSNSGRRRMMSQQDGEPPRPDLVTGVTTLEKVAQGGQGFITSGFDLGVLGGRNNVDDEIKQQSEHSSSSSIGGGGSQRSSSATQNVHYSSGGRPSSSNSYSSYSSHSSQGNSYNLDDDEYGDDYEINEEDEQNSKYDQNSHSSYSYSHRSRTGSDDPDFKHYRRTRRDLTYSGGENSLCESANCVNVRCVVGPLDKNTGALVALRMRPVVHTLQKLGGEMEVRLSTMAVGKITKLPYVGSPANETIKTHEVYVTAIPEPIPKPDIIPLWIFILAACAGALILLLLILLLYKCGFFKRNRPQGSPHERQPLNRNGNGFHGDEHL